MKVPFSSRQWTLILMLAVSSLCYGASGPVLVVHDGTVGLEATVVSNLTTHLTTAGYTPSSNVGVPAGSLATYKQIWDVRFNNTTPLTGSDITAYMTYLSGGGSLFVMGENTGFMTRNNSIIALIQQAGGGTISVTTPANAQTVQSPFTGPNALSTITFLAAAGTSGPGFGTFITKDSGGIGAGLVYGPGNLYNANAGSLLIVFDVNFLDSGADANSQTLIDNMIAYLAAPIVVAPPATLARPVSTPTMSEWALILLAGGLMFVASRRLIAHRSTATITPPDHP